MADKRKIILGIDPGIADTGYGLIESVDGQLKCLDYGSIKTDSKKDLAERLMDLHSRLQSIISAHRPVLASIELLFFSSNAKTAFIVGQARGVALLCARQNGLAIAEFTPLQIKQSVTNYGQADKKQVQKMVKLMLKLKELPKPDDAADALAAAICALGHPSLKSIKN